MTPSNAQEYGIVWIGLAVCSGALVWSLAQLWWERRRAARKER